MSDTLQPQGPAPGPSFEGEHPGLPSLARRRQKDRWATIVMALVMAITIAILLWVLGYVAVQGLKYLGIPFLVHNPPGTPAAPGGGFANGILGSFIVVGIATGIAVPLGIGAAIY